MVAWLDMYIRVYYQDLPVYLTLLFSLICKHAYMVDKKVIRPKSATRRPATTPPSSWRGVDEMLQAGTMQASIE